MPERRKMKSPSPQMTSTPKMKRKERETDSPLEDMKTRLGLKDKSDISLETVDISDYDDGTTRPMFSKRLRNVTAGAGEVAQLECVVAGTPQPRVLWLKNNRPLKATDGCKVMTDEGKNILCFPSANDDDVGTYTARAMNINGSAMSTAEFTLTSGKTLPALPLTEDMDFTTPAYFFQMSSCEVSEGRLARFDCRVVAYPKPDIVWMRDGKVIETADRFKLLNFNNEIYSLLIQDVKIEDTGRYTCWARNKFGEAMTEAYLNVIAFSEEKEDGDIAPKFLTRFYDQQITEGTAMDFKSLIAGRPEPTVTWLLDEIELRDTPGLRMRHKDGMISLEMKSPKMNQSGNYTCTIKNALGEATCSAKLTVIEDKLQGKMLPKFLKKFDHISAKENEEVKISCVVVGEPKPAVSWMFDHKSILETNRRYTIKQDGDVYTLTIKNARFDDAGTITCKAVNSEGEVYCSANIHVRESKFLSETPERRTSVDDVDSRYGYAPSFSKRLQDVQAKEGTKVKFECRFMGLPEPVVTWMKDGRVITDSDNYVVTRAGDSCQLEVERVSSSDTGVFTCIISNSKGKSSSTAGLKLEAAKKPTYERPKSAERTYRRERYTPEKKTSILEETRAAYKKSFVGTVDKAEDESRRYADLPEMKVPPILPTHRPVITDLGEETVRLAWRPAETYQAKRAPPVSYRLEAKELPDKDWMPLSSRLRDTTHYLDKLPVDRDYMIRVRAENDFGLSEPTEPLWLQRATAFPGVPVSRPQIVEIEANRAKLSWDRVDIPAFGLSDAPLTYMIEAQEPRSDWRPVARDLNDTFYIIDGLKPETDYRFRVRAKAPSGVTSEPSPIASLYTTLARSMAPVDRLEVVDYEVDTKSVQLSWQRVEIPPYDKNDEPLMYMLEYQEPPLPDWKPLVTGIPTTRYRVMHLDPDRDYNFRVRALTSYGISAPSPALPVALHKPPVVRPVLDPITISDVEPDSLRLSWRRPMYDPAKPMTYQIEMLEPPSRDWRTLASSYTDLTYKVTGLKPTKDYQFRVVPHVESRYLDSTPIAAITSLPVRPRLPMFTPTIKETTPESVQLSWRPAELPAYQRTRHPVFYRIEMQEVPSSSWSPVARRIPETTYTVTGLRPDNDYRFRVVAETDHSSSEPSMAALLHRKPAPRFPIQEPCIKDLSPNVVMLSWQPASVPAGGEDVSYRVEIQSPPGISSWTTLYASHATPSVRLADLRPDLDYLVRVRATTRSGFVSEPTLPVYIPRRAVPPRMNAEEPYAIEITPDSVKLQWRSADLPTHITDYAPVTYLLEALELPSGSWLTVGKGIPHTDFRVTGLSPSKGYSFRVRAENSYGISDPTKATTVKPRSVGPILPSDAPLMYDIGPGSVKLTWRPAHLPCHVTSNYPITYTIYLQEEPFKSWRPYVRRVPHPSYSIYGLRPDVAYDFRVEAENEYGTSQPTESVYLPRYMENTRPISMPEVSDFDENLRSVKLQWKPSAQPGSPFDKSPRKYMIETWEPIKREWHTQARGISDTSYRLRDLPKTSEPIFRVRMESDQTGLSEPSLPVSLGKFYRYRVPVYRPQLFELDNESVRLSWEPAHVPEGTTGRARYIIEQREIPETRWSQVVSDITETSYRIKGLRPKSDYEFRVKVVIDGTKSEPSFPVSLFRRHVIPSVQLETPEVTEVDETSIGLKWRMVDIPAFTNRDEPLSFIIERQELPSYEWKTVAHDIKDSTYKVSGLKPYQDYNFRIRGIYPSGYTAPSPYVPVYRRPSESKLGVFGVENSISGAKYTAPKPVATQNVPTYTPPRTGQSSDYSALHRSAIHSRMSRLAKIYDLTETSFGGEASFKSAEPMKPIFKREDAYVYKRPLSPPPSFAAVPRASPAPAPEPKSPVKLEDKYNLYQMYRKTRRHSDAGLEDVQKSRERRKHFEEELELEERKLELLAESQRRAKNRQAKAEKPKVTFEHVQATTSEKYASVADRYEDIKCPFIAEHWSFPRRHSFSLDPEDIENMKRATSFNYKPKAASQTKRFMSKTDDDILVSRRHHGDHYFLVQDEVDLYNKGYLDPGYFVLSKFSLSVTGTKKRRAASPPARRTYEEHVRYPGYSSVSADRSRSVSVSQAEQIADWQALSKSISKQLDKAKTKSERSRSEYKSTSRAGSVYSSISESRARSNSFSEQARHTPSRDRPHFNPLVEKSKTLVGDYTRLGQRMQEQDSYRATSVSSETSKQRSMSVADVKKDSRFSYTPRASVSTVSGSSTPHRLMTPAPHSRASISVPSSAEKRGSFDVRSDSRFSEHRRATFTTATATDDIKAKLDTLNSQLKSTTTKKKKTKKVMKFKSSRGEGFVME